MFALHYAIWDAARSFLMLHEIRVRRDIWENSESDILKNSESDKLVSKLPHSCEFQQTSLQKFQENFQFLEEKLTKAPCCQILSIILIINFDRSAQRSERCCHKAYFMMFQRRVRPFFASLVSLWMFYVLCFLQIQFERHQPSSKFNSIKLLQG